MTRQSARTQDEGVSLPESQPVVCEVLARALQDFKVPSYNKRVLVSEAAYKKDAIYRFPSGSLLLELGLRDGRLKLVQG
jgi:hypothetical protein